MKPISTIYTFMSLLTFFAVLQGCGSTKLVNSWNDPSAISGELNRIVVLGIFETDLQRRSYEDQFVKQLESMEIVGVTSYNLIGKEKDIRDESVIREAVNNAKADAVIIVTLVAVEQRERVVPPRVDYTPTYGYGGMYDYYGMSYRAVVRPGYKTIDTIVKLEATVFDRLSEKMIWAGATESFNPTSAEKVIKENVDIVLQSMKEANIFD